ncbi:MAG: M14 family zinc carboxypeptidase [Phycisphaerales bacterium]
MRTGPMLIALLAAAPAAHGQPLAVPGAAVRYDGHRLVRVTVRDSRELMTALSLTDDVWTCGGVGLGSWEARFSPEQYESLRLTGIAHAVITPDLQPALDAENARLRGAGAPDGPWFADFKTLAQISDYVDTLVALRPDLASRTTIGTSVQGRPIFALRISNDAVNPGRCKPAIIFNSTQHAREWIAPMVNMYAADRLVRDYGSDPAVTDLVDRVRFYIVSVTNPDGYQYSWDVNRYWRKNMRPPPAGSTCVGVDTNRNWSFQWGGVGASTSPCSETYRGAGPFSEPEPLALANFASSMPELRAHVDIHSYGQLLLHPWAFTPTPSPGHAVFQTVGQQMRQLILAVHNRPYTPGIWYSALYPSSGTATDWFYGAAAVPSFTFELRGPDFVLPPTEIVPNSEEIFPALLHYAQWTADLHPFRADMNNDCLYTVGDFGAFTNAFVTADPRADFTNDGQFTVADFGAFQGQWVLRR